MINSCKSLRKRWEIQHGEMVKDTNSQFTEEKNQSYKELFKIIINEKKKTKNANESNTEIVVYIPQISEGFKGA